MLVHSISTMLNDRTTLKPMVMASAPLIALLSIALITALIANEAIFFLLNQFASYHPIFWLHLTHFGDVLVATAFFSAFAIKHPKLLWSLAISILVSIFIVQGLKHAVNAPRPPAVLPVNQIHVIVPSSLPVDDIDLNIDYANLVDSRSDTAAVWKIIQSVNKRNSKNFFN